LVSWRDYRLRQTYQSIMDDQVYRKTNRTATVTGVDGFIADVSRRAAKAAPGWEGTVRFVGEVGEAFAFIRLQDLGKPLRFLKQLEGAPPLRFGTVGFKRTLVEKGDANPARHYTAFFYVGFWLPRPLAVAVLYWWEILGFIRYGFHWSNEDMRSGFIGIEHGRLVRRYGPTILPALIARDLAE
jgi:hypothetical protein